MRDLISAKDDMFVLQQRRAQEVSEGVVFLVERKDGAIGLARVRFHRHFRFAILEEEEFEAGGVSGGGGGSCRGWLGGTGLARSWLREGVELAELSETVGWMGVGFLWLVREAGGG